MTDHIRPQQLPDGCSLQRKQKRWYILDDRSDTRYFIEVYCDASKPPLDVPYAALATRPFHASSIRLSNKEQLFV